MNSESNKTPEPCRLLLSLSDEMDVRSLINMLFSQILMYLIH